MPNDKKIISVLLIIVTLLSTKSLVLSQFLFWLIYVVLLFFSFRYCIQRKIFREREYQPALLYGTYITLSICSGFFVASGYWMWKTFISSILVLSFWTFFFLFTDIRLVHRILRKWYKYALPLFIPLATIMSPDNYGIYLAPIILLLLYLKFIPRTWKYIVMILFLIAISDLGARSILLKYSFAIFLGLLFFINYKIPHKLMIAFSFLCFMLPITLFIMGVSGVFNIFEFGTDKNIVITKQTKKGNIEENLLADTRTFAYKAVLISSLKNNTIIWGMTPAKAAYVEQFDNNISKLTGRKNECGVTNLYMWCGVIGVMLLMIVYIQAVRLSLFKSKSYSIKLLGLYVAYRWVIFWIEDIQDFYIDNVTLHIMIAICYSRGFRNITDKKFALYINSLLTYFNPKIRANKQLYRKKKLHHN